MRAVHITAFDGPDTMQIVDIDEPTTTADQVVVDVSCCGVAFPDLLQSRGEYQYRPDPPFTPGAEVAGIVRSAPATSDVTAGDRVAVFTKSGGYSTVIAAEPDRVFRLPTHMSMEQGAGLLLNLFTAHFALQHRGGLRDGETVLVHGAAGGVGSAVVQLANALGARVIAVASTDEKRALANQLGAHDSIPVQEFRAAVDDLTRGRGVDLVVDPVGGDRITDSLRCLRSTGRLLTLGFTARAIPSVTLNRLLLNNISVTGVAWGAYVKRHPGYMRRQWDELYPLVESGALDPHIGAVFPLAEAASALLLMDARGALGKIVIDARCATESKRMSNGR